MSERMVVIRLDETGLSGSVCVDGQEVGGLATAIRIVAADGQVIGRMQSAPKRETQAPPGSES